MTQHDQRFKIHIVDDHPVVREGLSIRISLQPDLEVSGEAATEEEAIALANQTAADLMIVDLSLKGGHGLELIKRIKSLHPAVKMLVVSGFPESLYAERALRAGALGYVSKQDSNDKLIDAIRTVLAGRRFISPEISRRLVEQALGGDMQKTPIERLSDRELEVFRMIGEGLATGTIASQLFVSALTINTHRENIKKKLGLSTAGELSRAAVQWVLENG
jgi:DNA-binding NarL/FixJ family response regulator